MNFYNIDNINVINNNSNKPDIINSSIEVDGISILIPLYNGIEYLEQSVSSVINQTYKKWEIIIGINGYSEGSDIERSAVVIVEKLNPDKKYDILVKYYSAQGKPNTLNMMTRDTKYSYIAILDVDDNWVHNKLELQLPYLYEYDVVGGKCEYFGDRTGSPPIPLGDITHTHNIFDYNPIINSSVIIKKEYAFWDDEKYVKPVQGLDDYSLWFKLFFLKKKFYNLDKVLCNHRVHIESSFNYKCVDNVQYLKELWREYHNSH